MNFDIGVVIPVRNEKLIIETTLDSYSRGADNSVLFILVDNNSTDNTPQIIQSWHRRNKNQPIMLLHEKELGASYAKRKGIEYAKNVVNCIVCVDADTYPLEGFYKHIYRDFSMMTASDVLCGRIRHEPYVRLAKYVYLPHLMHRTIRYEQLEVDLMGQIFLGGYFGIKSTKVHKSIFSTAHVLLPQEASAIWSRRCWYLGYKFTVSKPDIRASSRRFWADPFGGVQGIRSLLVRKDVVSAKKREKIFINLQKKESVLCKLQHEYFTRRLLLLLLDAVLFQNEMGKTKRVNRAVEKCCSFLGIHQGDIARLSRIPVLHAKSVILSSYLKNAQALLGTYLQARC